MINSKSRTQNEPAENKKHIKLQIEPKNLKEFGPKWPQSVFVPRGQQVSPNRPKPCVPIKTVGQINVLSRFEEYIKALLRNDVVT